MVVPDGCDVWRGLRWGRGKQGERARRPGGYRVGLSLHEGFVRVSHGLRRHMGVACEGGSPAEESKSNIRSVGQDDPREEGGRA